MDALKILFSCYVIAFPLVACACCLAKFRRENQPHVLLINEIKRNRVQTRINLLIRRAR